MNHNRLSRKPETAPQPAQQQKPGRKRGGKPTGYLPPSVIGREEEPPTLAEIEENLGEDFDDSAEEEDDEFSLAAEPADEEEDPFREPDGRSQQLRALWIWTGSRALWCQRSARDEENLKRLDGLRGLVNRTIDALTCNGSPFVIVRPEEVLGSGLRILEGLFENEWLVKHLAEGKDSVRFSRDLKGLGIYDPGERQIFPLDRICPDRGERPSNGYLPSNLGKLWLFGEFRDDLLANAPVSVDWKRHRSRINDSYRNMVSFLNSALGEILGEGERYLAVEEKTLRYKWTPVWNRWLEEAAGWKKQTKEDS